MDATKFILCFFALAPFLAFSQNNGSDKLPKKYNIDEVEVDILGSYYGQEGNHSAVEGGEGDQHLTDWVNNITVNIPFDSVNIISGSFSFDTYTSASSTMIDWETVTSASYKDERIYGNLSYTRLLKNEHAFTVGAGVSDEYDVFSHSYSLGWQKSFDNENKIVGFDLNAIFDHWELIYPVEFRDRFSGGGGLDTDLRNTIGATFSYSAVINRKMQAQFVYNYTYQAGLLSTPFHRVYFDTTGTNLILIEGNEVFGNVKRHPLVQKDIERLPGIKHKHAFGLRTSNYLNNWLVLRGFYRYYFDSFGLKSHTVSVEFPVKPTRFISFYPFYRFYIQTESLYFAPFLQHTSDEEFYTSDYDLSAFTSHKFGLGLKISPPLGIVSLRDKPFTNRTSSLKSFELRFARYLRSDGLDAYIGTAGLSFTF